MCSVIEDETAIDSNVPSNFDAMNMWLRQHGFGSLDQVENSLGGSKHPQFFAAGAGFNFFPADEFEAFFLGLEWENPENAVLIMQPETGPTRVVRPPNQ